MCSENSNKKGVWIGIAVAIGVAVFVAITEGSQAAASDRIVVERLGDQAGPTIVFIPGLATPSDVFEPFADDARDNHLVTLAGFGGVPAPDDLEAFIYPAGVALAEYLSEAGVQDAVLVGHSLGGQVAIVAAGQAPDRVRNIVAVDSAPFFAALVQPDADSNYVVSRYDETLARISNMSGADYLAMMERGLPIQAIEPESQAQIMNWVRSADQHAVAVASAEVFAGDMRSRLLSVRAPVTLIYPLTPGFPPEVLEERYSRQYQGLDVFDMRPVADSRHFIMLDQPQVFAQELDRVVDGGQP